MTQAVARAPVVLLVDDQKTVLSTYQRLLRRKITGAEVLVASSAAEALALLRAHEIDLVLADYRMPHENGLDLLAAVHAERPGTRRVLFSAYVNEGDLDTAVAGRVVEEFVSKDLDPALLVERVEALLRPMRP